MKMVFMSATFVDRSFSANYSFEIQNKSFCNLKNLSLCQCDQGSLYLTCGFV